MDRLESLGSQLSKITMYDIKSAYNQAKNMVLNVSEMEAKVQEATNDDPWGASSTLMGEIAQGTFNFQQFNEIMPAIYSRFMDKEAREWRQIYKSLQLLEYIIKHGSERVVDDARSHLSTLKMLKNFHYIDEKGKDQGINVRNRAKEIAEMLSDLDRVRQERRKAKMNKNKYTGVGNDGLSFGSGSGGSRYGGFSSDDYYGGGGGGGGGGSSSYAGGSGNYGNSGGGSGGFSDSRGKQEFEEYDAGEWEDSSAHKKTSSITAKAGAAAAARQAVASPTTPNKPAVPAKDKAKEVDLLGFGFDDDVPAPAPAPVAAAPAVVKSQPVDDFDDFDDFQSAPNAPAPPAVQPTPASKPAAGGANVFDLLNAAPAAPPVAPMSRPMYGGMGKSNQGDVFGGGAPLMPATSMTPSPMYKQPIPTASTPVAAAGGRSTPGGTAIKSSANFDDLWSSTLTSTVGRSSTPVGGASGTAGKSIMDLQKEKAQAAFWGNNSQQQQQGQAKPATMGGGFGGAAAPSGGGGGGGLDDLLL
ncbi:hypothetical protein M408DRAFT_328395 [Serendipita vermifera MAFF 305830]|uniref:ENTH domain-containing protein n=1 Tax=Serendipita vermifera MAFF 305830 TaxID=933852 RepID=A0A0C2XLQ3_SERVB|nr:hypothetical protein M408DRAFT_328395 [Serendipita vermifera MAFF 305830]